MHLMLYPLCMQLKPISIYLEEDITKNVEFPTEGKFDNIQYGRFKCCGELDLDKDATPSESAGTTPFRSPQPWSLPRPWTGAGPSSAPASFARKKTGTTPPYEAFFKRSIPYVALGLDQSGKNIVVDTTINNVYIKIPENEVSGNAILCAMATKIGCDVTDLIMLDVKFIEISDDKGKLEVVASKNRLLYLIHTDLEYWKVPSRRFYVSKKEEYTTVTKVRARKRLKLGNRKRIFSWADDAVVSDDRKEAVEVLECKICRDLPPSSTAIVMVLCCKQIFGCQSCLTRCLRESPTCPLCRAESPEHSVVNGLRPLYDYFSSV